MMTKIVAALGILLLIAGGVIRFQYKENQKIVSDAATEIAEAHAAVALAVTAQKEQLANYNNLRVDHAREATERKALQGKFADLEATYAEKQAEFTEYRGRWTNAVMEKPNLVTRLATRGTNKWMWDLSCATSPGSDGCEGNGESSGGHRPEAEAGDEAPTSR